MYLLDDFETGLVSNLLIYWALLLLLHHSRLLKCPQDEVTLHDRGGER